MRGHAWIEYQRLFDSRLLDVRGFLAQRSIFAKQMSVSPLLHGVNEGPQGLTCLRKRVLDLRRNDRIYLPDDNTVALKVTKLRGQNTRTKIRFQLLNLVEAQNGILHQVMKDYPFPLAPNDFEARFDSASGLEFVRSVTTSAHITIQKVSIYRFCKYNKNMKPAGNLSHLFEMIGKESEEVFMSRTILIVHAHPEPQSLTRQLVHASKNTLIGMGHRWLETDLYGMRWKAVFDANDFPVRDNPDRLLFMTESGHAYSTGAQTADVEGEQEKLLQADAVIFQFPLWWFGFPAILKGWVDRVFARGLAYGYKGAGNRYRYGEGGLAGKRALLATTVGGPEADFVERGINGPLEQLLFPITHGTLFFAGMDVLPTFAIYGTASIDASRVEAAKRAWEQRLVRLFCDNPIPFRRQNDGDYPDGHQLAPEIDPDTFGIPAHIKSGPSCITSGIDMLGDLVPPEIARWPIT
jgi:NAD(P)H dehydrogenase (quinone)